MTETTDRLTASGEGVRHRGDGSDGDPPSPGDGDGDSGVSALATEPKGRTALLIGLVALAGGIPLAIALAVVRQPRWFPVLDLAQTELRLRDVTGGHPPLVGLAGRITGANGEQGSHPGPLSFWALWPFYKLFGSTSAAMQAASVSLNLIAMGFAVWIANRRAGRTAAIACALALAVLVRSYGAEKMLEPWNPYLPMLWWVVFLLAVWSVLCDDLPLLPVAVFAGMFCMQTHVPYSGLIIGMGLFVVAAMVVGARRAGEPAANRRLVRWGLGALALLVALWIPPLIDQLTNDPGNLTLIKETFQHPRDDPAGFNRDTVEIWLTHVNPWRLLTGTSTNDPNALADAPIPGVLLLVAWGGAVVMAWRARFGELLRLHLVVGLALALGLFSITRILGDVWYYLVLWAWGTTTLLIVATVWTYASLKKKRPNRALFLQRRLPWILTGALVVASGWFSFDARSAEVPAEIESRSLRHVVPQVVDALDRPDAPGGGTDGRYLLDWNSDESSIGSQGFGMLLALERAGLNVGVYATYGTGAVTHRVREAADATAVIHLVIGPHGIDRWRDVDDAVEVAYYEPRTEQQLERYNQLHDEVAAEFRAQGLDDLAERLDQKLFTTATDPRTSPELTADIQEMMRLGLPAAVFVAPVGVS